VRTMAQKLVESFKDLPDDAVVVLKQVNEESIHQHNAFAERSATMGELRAELGAEDLNSTSTSEEVPTK